MIWLFVETIHHYITANQYLHLHSADVRGTETSIKVEYIVLLRLVLRTMTEITLSIFWNKWYTNLLK